MGVKVTVKASVGPTCLQRALGHPYQRRPCGQQAHRHPPSTAPLASGHALLAHPSSSSHHRTVVTKLTLSTDMLGMQALALQLLHNHTLCCRKEQC